MLGNTVRKQSQSGSDTQDSMLRCMPARCSAGQLPALSQQPAGQISTSEHNHKTIRAAAHSNQHCHTNTHMQLDQAFTHTASAHECWGSHSLACVDATTHHPVTVIRRPPPPTRHTCLWLRLGTFSTQSCKDHTRTCTTASHPPHRRREQTAAALPLLLLNTPVSTICTRPSTQPCQIKL